MRFFCWQKWAVLLPQIFPKTPHPLPHSGLICENFHKPFCIPPKPGPGGASPAPHIATIPLPTPHPIPFGRPVYFILIKNYVIILKKQLFFFKKFVKKFTNLTKIYKIWYNIKKTPYFFSKNRPFPQKNKEKPAGLLTIFKKYVIIKWGIYIIYTHFSHTPPAPGAHL